jgi:CRP-like cAMP-binding protein
MQQFAHRASPSAWLAGARLLAPGLLSQEEEQVLREAASPPTLIRSSTDLFREGDRSDSLFVVTDGWAYRYMTTRDGARQIPALLVPGDVGNLGALMFDHVDYGVRAITNASVVALPKARVLTLGAKHPGIAQALTWLALAENAALSKWALLLARRSAKERLAHLFCELSVRLHGQVGNTSRFAFPLTQEQIGDALGLTAVHVNRTMQCLRADGLAIIADRAVTLPDVAQLQQTCGFDARYLHADPVPSHQMKDVRIEHDQEGMREPQDGAGRASANSGAVR